jgi:hypothetical protein
MTSIRLSAVTVDCPDARTLAAFYAAILDGEVFHLGTQWASVTSPNGRIDFQTVPGYQPPRWPDPTSSIKLHLDFLVTDRAAAEARVLSAGATKFTHQPNPDQCYVYADPAGHPFCLTTWPGTPDAPPEPPAITG